MTARIITFTISHEEECRVLGHAVMCPAARYASVLWSGTTRLDRRFGRATDWKDIGAALGFGLTSGPLEPTSPWLRVLVPVERRSGIVVQYVSAFDLDLSTPAETVTRLDALLRSIAA